MEIKDEYEIRWNRASGRLWAVWKSGIAIKNGISQSQESLMSYAWSTFMWTVFQHIFVSVLVCQYVSMFKREYSMQESTENITYHEYDLSTLRR